MMPVLITNSHGVEGLSHPLSTGKALFLSSILQQPSFFTPHSIMQ